MTLYVERIRAHDIDEGTGIADLNVTAVLRECEKQVKPSIVL